MRKTRQTIDSKSIEFDGSLHSVDPHCYSFFNINKDTHISGTGFRFDVY